jgi:hypothetical protein
MSMLMIFTLMTYARLDSYRSTASIEGEFTRYMQTIERSYINLTANKTYDKIHPSSKKTASTASPPTKSANPTQEAAPLKNAETENEQKPKKSSGRLSIKLLINNKEKEKQSSEINETRQIFKDLLHSLYGNKKFFKDQLEKRPDYVDELLNKLSTIVETLPSDIKITQSIDLSNLELGDGLDETFYLMLKGCPSPVQPPKAAEITDGEDSDTDAADDAQEYTSDKSADSLLNFIDMRPFHKINIYLASKPLLLALYGNPAVVDNIMSVRYQLHQQVKAGMSKEEASEKLKAEFQLGKDNSLLDYKVTGTDPKGYN